MNVSAATAYLEHVEHADPRAAKAAARVLTELLESRWFFRSWWCQALEPCMAASPRMTGRPDTVVARFAHHFGLRICGTAPPCHTCRRPLRLADVQGTTPTGHCSDCAPSPAASAVPAPRIPGLAANKPGAVCTGGRRVGHRIGSHTRP